MNIKFGDDDFEIQWYSGTGKGGQHRNKHQNCCRVIHTPTGIRAHGTQNRSREDNKRTAMEVCKARVIDAFAQDTERYRATDEKVRTYHAVDNKVYDHFSGVTKSYKEIVDKNNLGVLIEARRKAMINN